MYLSFEQAISQQNVAKMHQLFAAEWQCTSDGYWMAPDDTDDITNAEQQSSRPDNTGKSR